MPTPTSKPKSTNTPAPEATPTYTPTPELPDFCKIGDGIFETYLFGVGATRVKELEPGAYQIVIDKNINAGATFAEIFYTMISQLDSTLNYQIIWLKDGGLPIETFNAEFNPNDGALTAKITNLREDDSGSLITAVEFDSVSAINCDTHPDFLGKIISFRGQKYLLIGNPIQFKPVLVKSLTPNSSGGTGSGSGSTGGGTPGGGTPVQ